MSRTVRYSVAAAKDLDRRTIVAAVAAFATGRVADVKKIAGQQGVYRLRVGRWRVLYELPTGEIFVLRIRDRKDAYR